MISVWLGKVRAIGNSTTTVVHFIDVRVVDHRAVFYGSIMNFYPSFFNTGVESYTV